MWGGGIWRDDEKHRRRREINREEGGKDGKRVPWSLCWIMC